MAHKIKQFHHGLLPQEQHVRNIFIAGVLIYFLAQYVWVLYGNGLLDVNQLVSGDWRPLWAALVETWQNRLGPVFIVLNIAGVVIFLYALVRVWPHRQKISVFHNPHKHHGPSVVGEGGQQAAPVRNPAILKHWTEIVKRANSGTPENLRWSIVEADALVDLAMKERGLPGDSMADRLANFRREDMRSLDRLWDAHRIRNEISHTPGFKVSSRQAEKALFAYRDFLRELKAF